MYPGDLAVECHVNARNLAANPASRRGTLRCSRSSVVFDAKLHNFSAAVKTAAPQGAIARAIAAAAPRGAALDAQMRRAAESASERGPWRWSGGMPRCERAQALRTDLADKLREVNEELGWISHRDARIASDAYYRPVPDTSLLIAAVRSIVRLP